MVVTSNNTRRQRIERHVISYANENTGGDIESALGDMIADIAHFADDYDGGDTALYMGGLHYREEVDEEEG